MKALSVFPELMMIEGSSRAIHRKMNGLKPLIGLIARKLARCVSKTDSRLCSKGLHSSPIFI